MIVKTKITTFLALIIGLTILLSSCQDDNKPAATAEVNATKKKINVPKFERDTAYAYVAKQVSYGPRVPNTDAHKATKNWLVDRFKQFGANVIEQDFQAKAYTGTTLNSTNIIAQFNPDAQKRILLAAHWDSRHIADSKLATERTDEPILGADDGGSGVAVLLEVARQLQQNPVSMGVDIILFDAEDHGAPSGADEENATDNTFTWCLGSQHWSKNPHVNGYSAKYGILLDMVGSRNARFTKEEVSMRFAPSVMNKVWKLAQTMGYGSYFDDAQTPGVTDDHYFVNTIARIPTIDIINRVTNTESKFGEHWHTHDDDMDIIDKRTLRAVGQVILAVIYREDSGQF